MIRATTAIHNRLRETACIALLALVAGGCDAKLEDAQFRCDPEIAGSCPTGWICQNRGTTDDWRCYSVGEDYCGNGIKEGDEGCDITDFGGETCDSILGHPGLIVCREDCVVHCTDCGNGRIEMIDEEIGEECDDGNTENGDGCSDLCRLERCGDGVTQEAFEVCDDGNNEDGDECSANCLSDETCGNGILDVLADEQCDDGNWRSNDGCSSTCVFELDTWTLWQSPFDGGRAAYDMVLDTNRDKIVLFGGRTMTGIVNEIWEYNGAQWFEVTVDSTPLPAPRQFHAMAYDIARQRTVLFGGVTAVGTFLADTWEYDGTSWVETTPAGPSPTLRRDHAMTYDAQRNRIVLFGGEDATQIEFGDTWEYDGASWVETTPTGLSPRTQAGMKMVYDTHSNRILLFGSGPAQNDPMELWGYNGSSWTSLDASPTPPERFLAAMSLDTDRDVIVVYGGSDTDEVRLEDTWEFDLSTLLWTEILTSIRPPGRERASMVYFPLTQKMVLHGGFAANALRTNTWEYDWDAAGDPWSKKTNTAKPPSREMHAMAYDPRREVTVVFGGRSAAEYVEPGTWEFNGQFWSKNDSQWDTPPARSGAQMVYDTNREVMVLYGGKNLIADEFPPYHTWEYDGTTWTPVNTPTAPPERLTHGMAYDAKEGVVVMYGGTDSSLTGFLNDTWIYDGTDWTERTPSITPSELGRGGHMMAYSPLRQKVLLFGGIHIFDRFTDTWLYDTAQNTWTELETPTSPSLRIFFGMVWNEVRQKMMIYGGFDSQSPLNDTWELDGFSWRRRAPVSAPNAPPVPVMVYDFARRQPMIYGGLSDETWMYRFGDPTTERCDNGEDDDGDNLIDCEDPDCALMAGCPSQHTICVNTDGTVRCEDPRCGGYPCRTDGTGQYLGMVCIAYVCDCPYSGFETDCTNGQDDNCDGVVDCDDTNECGTHEKCEYPEATCDDGFDNDGDWLVDCADDDCNDFPLCGPEAGDFCTDGFDNDGDGEIDCQDGDCILVPECPPTPIF